VAPLGLREVTGDPVQRPPFVERLNLAAPVAEVSKDARRGAIACNGVGLLADEHGVDGDGVV